MTPFRPAFIVPFWMLICTLIYLFAGRYKQMPSGDETISFLCASGHQGAYEAVTKHKPPYGNVSQSAIWQDFLRVEHKRFQHIADDLTQTDLHPPLYFWLLHNTLLCIPQPMYAGLVLNLLLHLAALLLLFALTRHLRFSLQAQMLSLACWSLSPAIIGVGLYARQYELLGLTALGACYTFLRFQANGRFSWWLLHVMSLVAGVLTQYLFIYYLPVFTLYTLFIERRHKTSLHLALAAGLSLLMLFLIHPGVWQQFQLQQGRAQAFALTEIPLRVGKTLLAFIQLWVPVLELKPWLLQLSLAGQVITGVTLLLTLAATGWLIYRKTIRQSMPTPYAPHRFGKWWLGYTLCLSILPYLLFLTPRHAMGGPYLVLVYPALILTFSPLLAHHIKAMITLLVPGTLLWLACWAWQQNRFTPLINEVKQADVVAVTSADRRGFLRLVPHLQPGTVVFMQAQPDLCRWRNKRVLLISDDATKAGVDSVLTGAIHYPLHDGVTFYAKVFTSVACDSSHVQ